MIKQENIEALDIKIAECENKQTDLRREQYELETAREELIRQFIQEDGLLNGTEWTVKRYQGDLYLEYNWSIDSAIGFEMKRVIDLCRTGWHSSFNLDKNIELQFDDNKVSIWFDDQTLIKNFIADNKLVISENFSKKIADLKNEINILESLFNAMK